MKLNKLTIIMTCSLIVLSGYAVLAESDTQAARPVPPDSTSEAQTASQDWGELVVDFIETLLAHRVYLPLIIK